MKNKIIVLGVLLIVVFTITSYYFYFRNVLTTRSRLVVQPIGPKGIFVGDSTKSPAYLEKSKLHPKLQKELEEHQQAIKKIDESWENLRRGDSYFKMGQYDDAIEAYKRAYELDQGDRGFFGLELVKAYEKLQRYDEALALLDEIYKSVTLSEYGIQKFDEIRTRLLAAKSQANPKQSQ